MSRNGKSRRFGSARLCMRCKASFVPYQLRHKFCSETCKRKHNNSLRPSKAQPPVKRQCAWCGKQMLVTRLTATSKSVFCCLGHSHTYRKALSNPLRKITKQCWYCTVEFSVTIGVGSGIRGAPTEYCSDACFKYDHGKLEVPQTHIIFCQCGTVEPVGRSNRRRCKRCVRALGSARSTIVGSLKSRVSDLSTEKRLAAETWALSKMLKKRARQILSGL